MFRIIYVSTIFALEAQNKAMKFTFDTFVVSVVLCVNLNEKD